jgi:hypothetical protein
MAMFGWTAEDTPEVTEAERSKLEAAERLTDELVLPAYSVLDEAARQSLLAGVDAIGDALVGK